MTREQEEYEAARARYDECVAAKSEKACEPLAAELRVRSSRYEDHAQQRWGCENDPDDCRPPRGP